MLNYKRLIDLLNKETGKGNLGRQESVERLKMHLKERDEASEKYILGYQCALKE